MKIGIIGAANIAERRFLPALKEMDGFDLGGIASRSAEDAPAEFAKARQLAEQYGCKHHEGYNALVGDVEIGAVYVPLPPALHYEWAEKSIAAGKHVLLEKPFTTNAADTAKLLRMAEENTVAVHENYAFVFHKLTQAFISRSGVVGEARLFRLDFAFPFRSANDFRYNDELGGGALLDCGGYPLKLATLLLGDTVRIVSASLGYRADFDVDIYGNATLVNDAGVTAQVSFGMDDMYVCRAELRASVGILTAERIYSAPSSLQTQLLFKTNSGTEETQLGADDSFHNSISRFRELITNTSLRKDTNADILKQAELTEEFRRKANEDKRSGIGS